MGIFGKRISGSELLQQQTRQTLDSMDMIELRLDYAKLKKQYNELDHRLNLAEMTIEEIQYKLLTNYSKKGGSK